MDSSYFPIYSYPLSVSSEISSLNSISIRSNNNNITTNDYLSSYLNNTSTCSSTLYTNSKCYSSIDQSNIADVNKSIDLRKVNVSLKSLFVSHNDHCLVCNDRASGIHFGVLTCEACKAFFRRISLSCYTIPSACSPIRCEINIKNRNNCPGCRFDRCKRLGMDRNNVIYGKPSKNKNYSSDNQDYFIEDLTNILNELMKIFQNIISIYEKSLFDSFEIKQQIDHFSQISHELFYQKTSQIYNINLFDIMYRILTVIFNLYKTNSVSDYNFIGNINFKMILCLWLFVYYYETFLLKQKISQEKQNILIKVLNMELLKLNQYYAYDRNKTKYYKINFVNTFTTFADYLQEIHTEK